MTHRTWVGRLLARVTTAYREPTAWRDRLFARLTLQTLPDRDGASSLTGVEDGLLLRMNAGANLSSSSFGTESPPTTTNRPDASSDPPSIVDPPRESPGVARSRTTDKDRTAEPAAPLPAFGLPSAGAEFISPTPADVPVPEQQRGYDPVPVGQNHPQFSNPTSEAVAADTAQSAEPAFAAVVPLSPVAAPIPLLVQQVVVPAETEVLPSDPVAPSGNESSTDVSPPVGTVETPPTFIDGHEPVGDVHTVGGASSADALPSQEMSPDGAASQDSLDGNSGGHGEHETLTSSNVSVTPDPDASGPAVRADTAVFRISGAPDPGEKLEVRYTLSAHSGSGTLSADGSVTLTNESAHVAVTPGPALAGRCPEILTILLHDGPGLRPARVSATLYLAPAGERIGDSALFEAHRVGRSPEAFATLVQRHGPAVGRVCERIVGNRADAEDVAQFVFLRLARWQLPFPGTLTGWLRTVSKNASLAFLRSKRRRLRYERAAAKPVSVEPPDSTGLDESLDAAIRQLPVTLGEAVRLRYLEGRSQQEAALVVGCPRGTLSRRAAHGIRVLRELLEGDQATMG